MICEYCKQEHDGSYGSGRFCSAACRSKYARKISSAKGANATKENYKQIRYNKLQLVLQNKADVTILKKKNLKDLLIEFGYKQHICENCKLTTWLNLPISLQLHHIDGNHDNNNINNLQLLCPNCHAQTDTYGLRNMSKKMNKNVRV